MRNRYRWSMGLVFALAAAGACAQGGRIEFYGAVVEPTCSTDRMASQSQHADENMPLRLTCGQTPTDPGRSYLRTVVSLDAATAANDRLLNYFAGYANPAGADGMHAKLVVRTYE